MSTEVAASTTDIAEVMAMAGQLGIENEHLVEFTRTMIDLGNSTDVVASEAATMLARFANITQMDQSQFDRLGAALVDLGNNYATTESEIVNLSMRLAAAGHQIGLTEPQILGFATALSSVGVKAEMGGSAFSNEDAWIVRQIYEDFVAGMTYIQIIDRLSAAGAKRMRSEKPFSVSAVQAILNNELYVGDRNLRKSPSRNYLTKRPDLNAVHATSYHQHDHEPIIDRDMWECAQAILAQRKKEIDHGIHRKGKETHFLYGKVFCAGCGAPYTRRTFKEEAGMYKVWYCRERQKGKSDNRCKNAGIREDVLLRAISDQLGCDQADWEQVAG